MKFHMKGYYNTWDLNFWNTGEWQVIKERLNDLDRKGGDVVPYCPRPIDLFKGLARCPLRQTKCVFVGQDPYPNPIHATGIAFSIPPDVQPYPGSLINIFKEYSDDLGYSTPSNGCLEPWCERGVLLWNAYPSVQTGCPGSHHWTEWEYLTREVLGKAADRGAVLVYLGRVAKAFAIPGYERQLFTSHPSPLGAKHGFLGSRIFSRVNHLLDESINWKLHHETSHVR